MVVKRQGHSQPQRKKGKKRRSGGLRRQEPSAFDRVKNLASGAFNLKAIGGVAAVVAIGAGGFHYYQQGALYAAPVIGETVFNQDQVEINQRQSYFVAGTDDILFTRLPSAAQTDAPKINSHEAYQNIQNGLTGPRHAADPGRYQGVTYVDFSDNYNRWLNFETQVGASGNLWGRYGDLGIITEKGGFDGISADEMRDVIARLIASGNRAEDFRERYNYYYDRVREFQRAGIYPFVDENGKDLIGLGLWVDDISVPVVGEFIEDALQNYKNGENTGVGALYRLSRYYFEDNNPGVMSKSDERQIQAAIAGKDSDTFDDGLAGEMVLDNGAILFGPDYAELSARDSVLTAPAAIARSMEVIAHRFRSYIESLPEEEKLDRLYRYPESVLENWFAFAAYAGAIDTSYAEKISAARMLMSLEAGGLLDADGTNTDYLNNGGYENPGLNNFGVTWIAAGRSPQRGVYRAAPNLNSAYDTLARMTDTSANGFNILSKYRGLVEPQLEEISESLRSSAFSELRNNSAFIDYGDDNVRAFFQEAASVSGAPILRYLDLQIDVLNEDSSLTNAQSIINALAPQSGLSPNQVTIQTNAMIANLPEQAEKLRNSNLSITHPRETEELAKALDRAQMALNAASTRAIPQQPAESSNPAPQPS